MKTTHFARLLAVGAGAALLSGCATVFEGKYAWREGWREARVVEVGVAADIARPNFHECIRKATPEQAISGQFAVVSYKQMARERLRAVPIQPGGVVSAGDAVYVRAGDCATSLVPRSLQPQH